MIAALWVPDLPLQALLRAESDVPDESRAWGVVEDGAGGGGALLLNVSPGAEGLGVHPGDTVAQAQSRAGRFEAVPRQPLLEASATEALRDVARSFSPRVELDAAEEPLRPGRPPGGQGWAFADVSGLETLVGQPPEVAHALRRALDRVGLPGRVGVARTKALARLVALGGEGCQALVGPRAAERAFVAELPLALLGPSPALAATLGRFGLERVGQLLQLASRGTGALAERLGPEGVALFHRAAGEDRPGEALRPQEEQLLFSEGVALDYGVAELEPLAFVLRGLLDRLVSRLALRSLLAGNLHLKLIHEGRGEHECGVEVAVPTRDVRALVALCRLRLETTPPAQPVTGLWVSAEPHAPRPRQLSFFEAAGPAPDKLAVTVARLTALCGEGRVGAPRPLDSWEDDAFALEPFVAPEGGSGPAAGGAGPGTAPPALTLRRFRPPRSVTVRCYGGQPARLEGAGLAGRVVCWSGPFRRRAGWWQQEPGVQIDAYDVQLGDGVYYRLHFERLAKQWRVVGWYD